MGDVMMDQSTIDKLQLERDRVEVTRKYEREQTLKSFYEQIREERVKQSKLKKTIRIIVISFCITNDCDGGELTNTIQVGKQSNRMVS
jgi:hypothetical protein